MPNDDHKVMVMIAFYLERFLIKNWPMKKFIPLLTSLTIVSALSGCSATNQPASLTKNQLVADVTYLASDDMNGRENFSEELNKADVSKEQLEVLAEKLQDFVSSLNKGLQFSVHEESGRDVIKVIDRESDEVVRQYPSEEVLELVAKLSDAAGNFINSKA